MFQIFGNLDIFILPAEGEVVEAEEGRRPVSQVRGQERWGETKHLFAKSQICWGRSH